MKEKILIRIASLSDLAVIQSAGCEIYSEHFSEIWSDRGLQDFLNQDFNDQELKRSLTSLDQTWFLAISSINAIVGYAKVNWNKTEPISKSTGGEIQKIYFSLSATGKGYGKNMLDFIKKFSIKRGQDILWLDVLESNLSAQKFYSSNGFEKLGNIPFATDLLEIGMSVMRCHLTANEVINRTIYRRCSSKIR